MMMRYSGHEFGADVFHAFDPGRLQSDAEPTTTGIDNSTEQEALAYQLPNAVANRR